MFFFPLKNSKLTRIQWSPSYHENSAEGFNKWSGRSVLHNRTGLSTLRTLIKSVLKSLTPVRWPNSDLLLIPWFILLLASICCNTKTLEAEKFLSSSQIFLKKVTFNVIDLYLIVLGHTKYKVIEVSTKYNVTYQVQSTFCPVTCNWYLGGKYKVQSTWPKVLGAWSITKVTVK